ncbi:MAG: AraC family transcriptional regulator [Steroidobacteraceae bacterium]
MNLKARVVSIMVFAALSSAWMAAPGVGAPGEGSPAAASDAATPPPAAAATSPAAGAAPAAAAAPPTPGAAAPEAAATAPNAAPDAPPAELKTLDQEVQGLKKDVIDLNKDLFVLQEELLFPANTQVALYISMDVGTFFALDSVTVKIDNKEVKNYLYTAREADALLKGAVQQIYLGNLKVGKHELVAFFNGKGPVERNYKRGATINFDKGVGAKYLELKITDRVPKHQPEFMIKDWE